MRGASPPCPPGAVPQSIKSALAAVVAALFLIGAPPSAADESGDARSRLERLGSDLGRALGTLRERLTARDSLRQRLAEADRRVAVVSFQPGSLDANRLANALYEKERIGVTTRGGQDRPGLRVSPHFYNTPAEVDRLVSAVAGYLKTGV